VVVIAPPDWASGRPVDKQLQLWPAIGRRLAFPDWSVAATHAAEGDAARDSLWPGVTAVQLPALTGLRAAAAGAVMLYHFREVRPAIYWSFGIVDPIIRQASVGVDVFFVLSGFVLCHVYGRTFSAGVLWRPYIDFLRNRLARLYPIHLITLAAMLALYAAGRTWFGIEPANTESYTASSIAHNLLLTHAWFRGAGAPNTPAWSVSAEWFAYLFFPCLCVLTAHRSTYLIIALDAVMMVAAQTVGPLHPLLRVTTEFSVGVCTYMLVSRAGWRLVNSRAGAALALAAFVGVMSLTGDPDHWLGVYTLLTTCLIVCLLNDRDACARLFRTPVFVYLGEISYSLYMCHWLVWSIIKHSVTVACPWFVGHAGAEIVLGVAATIFTAALTHRFVELPWRRAMRSTRLAPAVNSSAGS